MSEQQHILFQYSELSRFFPFYLLLHSDTTIESCGQTMTKLLPGIQPGALFSDDWTVIRPRVDPLMPDLLHFLIGKLVVIAHAHRPDLKFKGQFERLASSSMYCFVGTPWFNDTDQLQEYGLVLSDFAVHDTMIDLLHVLKNNDIATQELTEVVSKVKKQKKALTISNERLELLQSLIDNSSDAVQVSEEDGRLFYINNEAAERLGIDASQVQEYNVRDFEKIFEDPAEWQHHVDELKKVEYLTIEGQNVHQKTGVVFPVEVTVKYIVIDGKGYIIANSRDITERKKNEEQVRIQEEKYRNIIANMNLGLLEVDRDDHIQYCNQSFSNLCGYTLEEMLGKRGSDLFASEEGKAQIMEKNKLREKGKSDSFELIVRNKRGEARWWLVSGAPRYNDEGELVGSIGIHLDITEQKRLEKELERALVNAQEASEAKAAFLANMSHEIRTPLNGIIGMMRELSKENLSERQNSYLSSARKASQHLLAIINNILDISKIEAGELQLEQSHFSIREVMTDVARILENQASERGIEFNVRVDDFVSAAFVGDATRIRQILINLAGNAIKFTEKGFVEIQCYAIQVNKYHQELTFSIKDTGVGMEDDFIAKVFTKFQQEDKSSSRRFGGTGLGMAITKELVELMNGTIVVRSEKGRGTDVQVRLTLPTGDPKHIEPGTLLPEQVTLHHKSVLLVEDNEMNRLVAINALAPYNMIISEAENGQQAIDLLQKENFDVILMDLQMPVMGGLEATRILRKVLKVDTPVIALTANAFKSEIDTCMEAGMTDYVIKPFEEKTLVQAICKAFASQYAELQVGNVLDDQLGDVAGNHLYDLSKLKTLSRGNEDFVLKMLGLFVDMMPRSLAEISNSLENGDIVTLKRVMHRIKPSVDNMGIVGIIKDLKEIEQVADDSPVLPLVAPVNKIVAVLNRVVDLIKKTELDR